MLLTGQPRVCIIGAGAGGLSAAVYLKKRGYTDVLVLESADRIGGLCDSFTFDSLGFDLGGNYVLPGYTHVRELAEEVHAELIPAPSRRTWDTTMNGGQGGFRSPLSTVLQGTTPFEFTAACARYLKLLLHYRTLLTTPGLKGVADCPDLCQPFSDFLVAHDLLPMQRLFAIPISIMGYGAPGLVGHRNPVDPFYFQGIPAIYALKYVNENTLPVLLAAGAGLPIGWPRRFRDGYQRFWERLSWGLTIELNAHVHEVTRGDSVTVRWTRPGSGGREDVVGHFDALILACPPPAALRFLDATEEEQSVYKTIRYNEYCVTMAETRNMPAGILDVIPLTPFGHPFAMVKQWPNSELGVYYTPASPELTDAQVREFIAEDMAKAGGQVARFHQQKRWQYFPHFTSKDLQDGFADRLEALQGKRRTWLLGCAADFELVENAMAYSRARIERDFPKLAGRAPSGSDNTHVAGIPSGFLEPAAGNRAA